ncbi:MAG: ABC transporter substrate-binding protein, partial [Hungatella sp.]
MKKLPIGLLTVMLCGLLAGCSGNGGPQQNAETKAPEAMTEAKQQAEANPTTEAAAAEAAKGQETAKPETVKLRVAYHPNFGGNNLYITA